MSNGAPDGGNDRPTRSSVGGEADVGFDAEAEYRDLRESASVVARDDLAVIRMWGRDPARMLNGLITNDLAATTERRAVYAAMLNPKGRMIADLRAFRGRADSEIWVIVPESASRGIADHLTKYLPPLFARWEFADRKVIGVYGPRASTVLEGAFDSVPDSSEDAVTWVDGQQAGANATLLATRITGDFGWDIVVGSEVAGELAVRLAMEAKPVGGGTIDFRTFEVARVEAGRPRYGLDMTDNTLPAEAFESTGLMARAVSFTKGCYTGQEVVVRIAHRGHVNRLLRGLRLEGSGRPTPGTPLFEPDTGKEIGWTTSSVESPRLRQTIALGYVRREKSPGDQVLVGNERRLATLASLPFPVPA